MKGKLKWVLGLLFENFWWKLASLVIAVAIWAMVASEPELATFATVRLEYRNLPEDLEISSEPVTSITLELRGPAGELRGLGESARPAVVLDMSGVQPGERTFTIGNGNVRLARGVRLVRAVPSEARLDFERRAERDVKVVPRFTEGGQSGYAIARYSVEPKELRIAGPASHVARVTAAVTDPVNVGSAVGVAEFRVNAFVEDPYVRFLDSAQVAVTITMRKK
jgi:YbbR domain-containing protein